MATKPNVPPLLSPVGRALFAYERLEMFHPDLLAVGRVPTDTGAAVVAINNHYLGTPDAAEATWRATLAAAHAAGVTLEENSEAVRVFQARKAVYEQFGRVTPDDMEMIEYRAALAHFGQRIKAQPTHNDLENGVLLSGMLLAVCTGATALLPNRDPGKLLAQLHIALDAAWTKCAQVQAEGEAARAIERAQVARRKGRV